MDRTLKRKITNCWNIISDDRKGNPFAGGEKSRAFYQLEYILTEAGLLARTRERRHHGETQLDLAKPD